MIFNINCRKATTISTYHNRYYFILFLVVFVVVVYLKK